MKDKRFTSRIEWEKELHALADGRSWHTRSGIGAARDTTAAMLGDECLGYWDDARGEGWTYSGACPECERSYGPHYRGPCEH